MFRLVVLNQELFAAFVTRHPFGEDVLHRRYHYCFLATPRTRKRSLVELGQFISHLILLVPSTSDDSLASHAQFPRSL